MPNLRDVKQQLREWEQSHTTVMLSFLDRRQFWIQLFGPISCGTHCANFELIRNDGSGRFASPLLSAFKVVSFGPHQNFDNHTTIKLRHRRYRWEITLVDVGAVEEPTVGELEAIAEAFIASEKRAKRKTYVN
jgi:hypothetical protein